MVLCCRYILTIGGLSSCKLNASQPTTIVTTPTTQNVLGLTEAELRAKYPDLAELDGSFSLLVSKQIHPYRWPANNKLLRFGRHYLVAELKDGRVIALHRVGG